MFVGSGEKLESTYEKPAPGTFAEFALKELKQYVESRSELHDNFYKHLVINTGTRTFEDVNYVNSIGSKVVIRPLAETFEISAKKDLQLQRTVVLWILPQHPKMQWQLETHHQVRYQNPKRKL